LRGNSRSMPAVQLASGKAEESLCGRATLDCSYRWVERGR